MIDNPMRSLESNQKVIDDYIKNYGKSKHHTDEEITPYESIGISNNTIASLIDSINRLSFKIDTLNNNLDRIINIKTSDHNDIDTSKPDADDIFGVF